MIYRDTSLELFNDYIKNVLLDSFINTQGFMMLFSYLGNLFCTLMLFHATTVIYHQKVSKLRLFIASIISCFIYSSSVFICVRFLNIFLFKVFITHWLSLYPPYFIIIIYFLIVYVLGINKNRCMYILNYFYYLLVFQVLIYLFYDSLCFYLFTQNRKYEYTVYFIANSLTYITMFVIYFCFIKYVIKHKIWFADYMINSFNNVFSGIIQTLLKSSITYFLITQIIFFVSKNLDFMGIVFLLITLIFLLIAINFGSFNHNYLTELRKKMDSSKSLMAAQMKAISEFSAVKHDIANMLQVYHGYITIGDLELLKKYHQSVYKLTIESSDRLSVSERIYENPSLYTTLLYKMDKAAKLDVNIRVSCVANASKLAIHPLDLSRALGILLDNAIEEAVETEAKFVQFFTELNIDGTFLITVSNSTKGYVDTRKIFEENYTTKQNHDGIGLYEMWIFAAKLKGCNFNVEYVNNSITFYLKIPYLQNDKESSDSLRQYFGNIEMTGM